MKKLLCTTLFLCVSGLTSVHAAAINTISVDKQALKSALADQLTNQVNWALNRSGDTFTLQNSSTPTMTIDFYVNQYTNGKVSDTVYMLCGSTGLQAAPNIHTLCNVPYTNFVSLGSNFANGASGYYSVLGHFNTPTSWSLGTPGFVSLLNNATTSPVNVLYYSDYYYNNTTTVSSTVLVTCTNKTFSVNNGQARICQLPAGAVAKVELPSYYGKTASGGFMVLP